MSLTEKTNNKGNKVVVVSIAEDSNLTTKGTQKSIADVLNEQRRRKNSDDAWSTAPDYMNDLVDMLTSQQSSELTAAVPGKSFVVKSIIKDCIADKKQKVDVTVKDMSHLGIYSLEDKLRYIRLLIEFIIEKYVTPYMGVCKKSANGMEIYTGAEVYALHDIDLSSSLDINIMPSGSFNLCMVDVILITDGDTSDKSSKDCLNFIYDMKDLVLDCIFVDLYDDTVRVLEKMFED